MYYGIAYRRSRRGSSRTRAGHAECPGGLRAAAGLAARPQPGRPGGGAGGSPSRPGPLLGPLEQVRKARFLLNNVTSCIFFVRRARSAGEAALSASIPPRVVPMRSPVTPGPRHHTSPPFRQISHPLRPISLLRLSLLRFVDSRFPGDSL